MANFALDQLQRKAADVLKRAKDAEAAGKRKESAELFRSFAEIARKMADVESNQQDRMRLYQKAKEAEDKAVSLEKGQSTEHPDSGAGGEVKSLDDYKASVDELIYRSPVKWEDIGGMDEVKASLKYMMGLMLAKPAEGIELDNASRILLFGPPGTGKTLLAAACSNLLGATFFNVKASDMLSKYFGESTKLISALFARARSEADAGASVIFLDEFDAVGAEETGGASGAERRILATLLAEMDGLAEKGRPSRVITIAATNYPWKLRDAIRERFDRQIFIDLPDKATRVAIFKLHVEGKGLMLADCSYEWLADRTENFSGRLIQRTCKASIARMVGRCNRKVPELVDAGKINDYVVRTEPLTREDFQVALQDIKPSVTPEILRKYQKFQCRMGGEKAH